MGMYQGLVAMRAALLVVLSVSGVSGGVLEELKALPALPVPHYAWPFCHLGNSCTKELMATRLPWSSPEVMKEYARITGSVSTYASPQGDAEDIEAMWEK